MIDKIVYTEVSCISGPGISITITRDNENFEALIDKFKEFPALATSYTYVNLYDGDDLIEAFDSLHYLDETEYLKNTEHKTIDIEHLFDEGMTIADLINETTSLKKNEIANLRFNSLGANDMKKAFDSLYCLDGTTSLKKNEISNLRFYTLELSDMKEELSTDFNLAKHIYNIDKTLKSKWITPTRLSIVFDNHVNTEYYISIEFTGIENKLGELLLQIKGELTKVEWRNINNISIQDRESIVKDKRASFYSEMYQWIMYKLNPKSETGEYGNRNHIMHRYCPRRDMPEWMYDQLQKYIDNSKQVDSSKPICEDFITDKPKKIEERLDDAHKIQRLWVEVTKLRREHNYEPIKVLYIRAIMNGVISPIREHWNDLEHGLLNRFYTSFREAETISAFKLTRSVRIKLGNIGRNYR